MPGTEELALRLQQLEDGYYGDKEAARQKQFFDTYGGRFSNNRGLGIAILNELDARGIDTSAADEAVQGILDTLRTECNEILTMLSNVQDAAIENQKKIDTIAETVADKVAADPNASTEEPPADMADTEFNPDEVPAEMPVDMAGAEPPAAEPPAEPPVAGAPAEMPAEPPAEPPVEEPDMTAVSDARMKRIERMKARWSNKNGSTVVSDARMKNVSNVFKPSADMLKAAMRGVII